MQPQFSFHCTGEPGELKSQRPGRGPWIGTPERARGRTLRGAQEPLQQSETGRPRSHPTLRVDMAHCSDFHILTSPGGRATARECGGAERVIGAGHEQAGPRQARRRNRSKSFRRRRKHRRLGIRHSDQKRCADRQGGSGRPMHDRQAPHAMGDQQRRHGGLHHRRMESGNPFVADRMCPITLPHTSPVEMLSLPARLPMAGP